MTSPEDLPPPPQPTEPEGPPDRGVAEELLSFPEEPDRSGRRPPSGRWKPVLFLCFVAGAVLLLRATGVTQGFDTEAVRRWVQGQGAWAPLAYMALFSVTPVLFLPGLPLTLAAGVLFGPFWGVVYATVGSTVGACAAFLVSRYLARDWVASRLRGARWQRLDDEVRRHGWKVVAFTRFVPIFPFCALNFAFGVSSVRFVDYAVATAVFMAPPTAAFVVFSSSLLDAARGTISPRFVVGALLVVCVSCIPFAYKRIRARTPHGRAR